MTLSSAKIRPNRRSIPIKTCFLWFFHKIRRSDGRASWHWPWYISPTPRHLYSPYSGSCRYPPCHPLMQGQSRACCRHRLLLHHHHPNTMTKNNKMIPSDLMTLMDDLPGQTSAFPSSWLSRYRAHTYRHRSSLPSSMIHNNDTFSAPIAPFHYSISSL